MAYTNREMVDMLKAYFLADESAFAARRLYAEWYPDRQLPNERTFVNILQRLRDFGSFSRHVQDNGREQTRRVRNVEAPILNTVDENPGTSTRRLSVQFQVSQSTVSRLLHSQGLYPYHVQKIQALQPQDFVRRTQFCEWLLEKCEEEQNFLKFVLWTDEAGFTREGVFNTHNTHIWADENPHATRESHFQQQFSINVWAGIIDNALVGPFVLPRRLNGQMYFNFLNQSLQELLEDVPLAVRRQMWFHHDGAPPHIARQVVAWLNTNFGNRWIGRNGPVPWPPRSPDLNPCDFYLWGHMKELVYAAPVNSVEELQLRVENAANSIRNNAGQLFENVRHSMRRRLQVCINNNGGHFQHLL